MRNLLCKSAAVDERHLWNASEGLFVVNTNGTGLKQITPADFDLSSFGSWSQQGNDIIFSRHVTPDVHSSIWVVHADGSGLHEINVQPASACGGANADPRPFASVKPRRHKESLASGAPVRLRFEAFGGASAI